MQKPNLDEIAKTLAYRLRESLCCDNPEVFLQLLRLLADGHSVSPEQIATTLNVSRNDVIAALSQLSNVEFDHEGNVVAAGLSLTPTRHRFQVSGHRLFTWCAMDALTYPMLLGQPARVESLCPATGVKIRLTVTPEGIEHLEPTSTVVSIVIPEASEVCCDVRSAYCNYVNFISSRQAAFVWLSEHQGAIILPADEAYQIGRVLAKHLYRETSEIYRNFGSSFTDLLESQER